MSAILFRVRKFITSFSRIQGTKESLEARKPLCNDRCPKVFKSVRHINNSKYSTQKRVRKQKCDVRHGSPSIQYLHNTSLVFSEDFHWTREESPSIEKFSHSPLARVFWRAFISASSFWPESKWSGSRWTATATPNWTSSSSSSGVSGYDCDASERVQKDIIAINFSIVQTNSSD